MNLSSSFIRVRCKSGFILVEESVQKKLCSCQQFTFSLQFNYTLFSPYYALFFSDQTQRSRDKINRKLFMHCIGNFKPYSVYIIL